MSTISSGKQGSPYSFPLILAPFLRRNHMQHQSRHHHHQTKNEVPVVVVHPGGKTNSQQQASQQQNGTARTIKTFLPIHGFLFYYWCCYPGCYPGLLARWPCRPLPNTALLTPLTRMDEIGPMEQNGIFCGCVNASSSLLCR